MQTFFPYLFNLLLTVLAQVQIDLSELHTAKSEQTSQIVLKIHLLQQRIKKRGNDPIVMSHWYL